MNTDRSEGLASLVRDADAQQRSRRPATAILALVIAVAGVAGFAITRNRAPRRVAVAGASAVSDTTDSAPSTTTVASVPSDPVVLSEVPSSAAALPSQGVSVNRMLLLPPPVDAAPSFSRSDALVEAARTDDNKSVTISDALLTSFTNPGSILPPGSKLLPGETANPIQNRLAWVVTVTASQPVNVSQIPGVTGMALHNELVFDANTGSYLLGFYTP